MRVGGLLAQSAPQDGVLGGGWFRQASPPGADEAWDDVQPIAIAEWKKGCNPAIAGVTAIVRYKVYAAWMFEACIPFGPLVASKVTFWPS